MAHTPEDGIALKLNTLKLCWKSPNITLIYGITCKCQVLYVHIISNHKFCDIILSIEIL